MKKYGLKIIFILLFSIGILLSYTLYNNIDPSFTIRDCTFTVSGGLENISNNAQIAIDKKVGIIEKKVILANRNNNEGFKIKEGSIVYSVNDKFKETFQNSVIIKIDNNYYIAPISIKNKELTKQQLEIFNERF